MFGFVSSVFAKYFVSGLYLWVFPVSLPRLNLPYPALNDSPLTELPKLLNNEFVLSNIVLFGFTPTNLVASTPPNLELKPVVVNICKVVYFFEIFTFVF